MDHQMTHKIADRRLTHMLVTQCRTTIEAMTATRAIPWKCFAINSG